MGKQVKFHLFYGYGLNACLILNQYLQFFDIYMKQT